MRKLLGKLLFHSVVYRLRMWPQKLFIPFLFGLIGMASLHATVLDNFTGPKTGWTDTLNGGGVLQSGGEFLINSAKPAGSLTFSRKTSATGATANGHSLEYRVNVVAATPASPDTNAVAILAWVPTSSSTLSSGYSVSVGGADLLIKKGLTTLYAVNFTSLGTNLANTNITVALRMTAAGGAVTLNVRVYHIIPSGLTGQYFTTLYEHTVVDASGILGNGVPALGVLNQASTNGAAVAFSNLQVFDTTTTVLDSFNSATIDTNKWNIFLKNPNQGDSVTPTTEGLQVLATIADASGGFAGLYSANSTYKIVDGGQVEFQLDIVNNIGQQNSYSALGYLPIANVQYIYGIVEYHIANDVSSHTVALSGKAYNEWWAGRNDIQPPYNPPGCRYIMTMTGEGANCRVESRIEDLSVTDPNDPARVVWQTEFIDTPAKDTGLNESSGTAAPYLNSSDGRFVVSVFNAGNVNFPVWATVVFSNAVVRQTLPGNTPPIIANVQPGYSANFVPSSSLVSFDVSDATLLPLNGLSVTLNGVTYANGSPSVTITPSGAIATARHFSLSGVLLDNINYIGTVQATDANGLTASFPLVFDTFKTNDFVVECEEFNFSTNGGATGGAFIDAPLLLSDGSFDPNAYNGQTGVSGVDYFDNRGIGWGGGGDANHTFRTADPVYTSHSSDMIRAKYANAGNTSAGFYETEVTDIRDGDWLNYTHAYPAGTYNVFLRQATFKLANSLVTLERVLGDPTSPSQTNSILGGFNGTPTGIGLFANVPLTDATGNPMVVRFSGAVDTLQIHNRVTGNANLDNGNLEQNYMVLVPVTVSGALAPAVSLVSPQLNSTLVSASPVVSATIVNRDTTVNPNSIILKVNGQTLTTTVSPDINGATVTAPLNYPLPAANSIVTNTLIYRDSAGVFVTNTWYWTLSYTYLPASDSLPSGSLSISGFDARLVQSLSAALGSGGLANSVSSAIAVLANPPQYTVDFASTNLVQAVAWDLNANAYGANTNFPGLCAPPWNQNSFAIETFAYVHMAAGLNRFYVDSDDAVGIYSGTNITDTSITLVQNNGVTHQLFEVVAAADGLYPLHIIYEEGGGAAYLVLKSVSLTDGTQTLVNTAGAAAAYYPLVCQSATSLNGPFSADSAANAGNVLNTVNVGCDPGNGGPLPNVVVTGGTITIPISGPAKFYRLAGPRPTTVTGITKVGNNVVVTYQAN